MTRTKTELKKMIERIEKTIVAFEHQREKNVKTARESAINNLDSGDLKNARQWIEHYEKIAEGINAQIDMLEAQIEALMFAIDLADDEEE